MSQPSQSHGPSHFPLGHPCAPAAKVVRYHGLSAPFLHSIPQDLHAGIDADGQPAPHTGHGQGEQRDTLAPLLVARGGVVGCLEVALQGDPQVVLSDTDATVLV